MSLKRLAAPVPIICICGAMALAVIFAVPSLSEAISAKFSQAVLWVFTSQRAFHRELITLLQGLSKNAGPDAGLWLVAVAFTYGVFHAAGPGHGKAVISTFLLTNSVRLRRGLMIAVGGALCQGLTAVVLVYGLIWVFGWRSTDTMAVISWSERISFVLLTGMGLYLLLRAFRGLLSRPDAPVDDDDDLIPDAEQINRADSPLTILGLMLAIGIRPCSGAVLVLIFAYTIHIAWAGVVAAMAMAAGTAITVSTLAVLSVRTNVFVQAWGKRAGAQAADARMLMIRRIGGVFALLCGGFLVFLGGSMLIHSFAPRLANGIL